MNRSRDRRLVKRLGVSNELLLEWALLKLVKRSVETDRNALVALQKVVSYDEKIVNYL